MKTTKVLMAIILAALTHSVIADNSLNMTPPPGPYKSTSDADQRGFTRAFDKNYKDGEKHICLHQQSGQPNRDISGWQRQRQVQMDNRMQQLNRPQAQMWNNPALQQNYNQRMPMPNPYSGQSPIFKDNKMQQPFPPARGPVYGPGAPPSDYYRQPMQQYPRY